MSFKRLDAEDIVISSDSITATLWSTDSPTLTTFFTNSIQEAGSSGDYYLSIYQTSSAEAVTQFDIAYCNSLGSGSTLYNSAVPENSPTKTLYGQYRTLILEDENAQFTFGVGNNVITGSDFWAINFERARYKESLFPGSLNLRLSGSGGTIQLTDNSNDISVNTFIGASRVFQLVSGSNGTAIAGGGYVTNSGSYGLVFPDLGTILLNPFAISQSIKVSPMRKVIRGGTRIEPILYSQSGSAPNATWNTTMSFTDIVPSNTGATGDYTATLEKTIIDQIITPNTQTKITFDFAPFGSTYFNNSTDSYVIPIEAINDASELTFTPRIFLTVEKTTTTSFVLDVTTTLELYKNGIYQQSFNIFNPITTLGNNDYSEVISLANSSNITPIIISSTNFSVGDEYSLYIKLNTNQSTGFDIKIVTNSRFNITQYPIFTTPIIVSGINTIWGWPNKITYPNIITSSNPTLSNPDVYGNPNVKAVDIAGSGFNSIQLPWSIEYGDEFRVEGWENRVFQVGKVDIISSSLIPGSPVLAVELNQPIPPSGSLNLNQFLIRRYIDDASQTIIKGFKPLNSTGPYIIKPEYVVPELHKWLEVYKNESERAANEHCDRLFISKPKAYRAIAPTGSIGILASTTTGIEPVYAVAYKRRYLTEGTKWKYQFVVDGTADRLIKEYGVDPEKIESATDLANDPERRIKFHFRVYQS